MQNKGAIWLFTILLALACLFQISFTFVVMSFENKAEEVAAYKVDSVRAAIGGELTMLEEATLMDKYKTKYLSDHADEEIYPIFGYTYNESKSKQIKLGLDLAGGMSVTLEVSIPDLILNLSNNVENEKLLKTIADAKRMQKDSQSNFVTLFGEAWDKNFPDEPMAPLFHSRDNKELFPREASNDEILKILHEEADLAVDNTEKILRTRIDKFGVTQPTIQKQALTGRILVELPGIKDKERVRKQLRSTANLEFWNTYENSEIIGYLDKANSALSEKYYPNLDEADSLLATSADTTSTDTAAVGSAASPVVNGDSAATDTTMTEAELLGLSSEPDSAAELLEGNEAQDNQLKRLPLFSKLNPVLTQTNQPAQGCVVGYALLSDTGAVNDMLAEDVVQDILPNDLRLLWSAEPATGNVMRLFAIKVDTRDGKAPLDGSVIIDASQQYDVTGQVQVSMLMNSEGARKWREITARASSQTPKRCVAIVLDGYVYSAPVVQSEIPSGQSSISMGSGNRTEQLEEALDLANLLKAGALPAPANIVNESVVGPSLGQENIDDGLMSFLVALVVTLVFMIVYYKGAGVVADIALIANLFFLVGVLASIQAVLTLPGIAGIVLTMGMAVDANVLIYERIREELRRGRTLKSALKEGYDKAYSAIIDGNVTTLLTAVVLLLFGTGPIKGFATTLIIGIFTSLFSAIFISRLIFDSRLKKGGKISFWMNWSKNVLINTKYKFMKVRKTSYIISSILILISVGSLVTRGLNFGVDFTGGRTYTVQFDKAVDLNLVRETLSDVFIDENGNPLEPQVKTFGAANQIKITTTFLVEDNSMGGNERVEDALHKGLDQLNDSYVIMESRKVDSSISDDFQSASITALLLALLIIFAYIGLRFRNWQYGIGALASLAHDAIITIGAFSLFYGVLPFSLEIDQAFIAAILTVIGYSVNDTVIIFDRIREYRVDHQKEKLGIVIDKAINETLSRTVITQVTVALVLIVIFVFGGESIRGFIFAMLVGILFGSYSSVFIAAPLMFDTLPKSSKNLSAGEDKDEEVEK